MESEEPVSHDCDWDGCIVVGPGGPHVRRFLDDLLELWPDMVVEIGDFDGGGFGDHRDGLRSWREARHLLPEHTGSVWVDRDLVMHQFAEEWAFALDERGEGPIQLRWSPLPARALRMTHKENPWPDGFLWEPYPTFIAGTGMSVVDAVTSDCEAPSVIAMRARLLLSLTRSDSSSAEGATG